MNVHRITFLETTYSINQKTYISTKQMTNSKRVKLLFFCFTFCFVLFCFDLFFLFLTSNTSSLFTISLVAKSIFSHSNAHYQINFAYNGTSMLYMYTYTQHSSNYMYCLLEYKIQHNCNIF